MLTSSITVYPQTRIISEYQEFWWKHDKVIISWPKIINKLKNSEEYCRCAFDTLENLPDLVFPVSSASCFIWLPKIRSFVAVWSQSECRSKMPLYMSGAFRWGKNAKNLDMNAARWEGCFALCLFPWRLFGCLAAGSVGCFGALPALPSQWWRHICAGRSGCSASIPAFMIARRCESRNTLYCTQTQKLMKLDCLPGHKFLNVYACAWLCMYAWVRRKMREGGEIGGECY